MEKEGLFSEPIEFYLGKIPFIITDLITQLIKINGQNSKILFNQVSVEDNLEELIDKLKSKRITDWSSYNNPATLSVCLLYYINSLFHEKPLITEDVQEFLLSTQITDNTSCLKLLQKILMKLYEGRFLTLSYLTNFLSRAYLISEDRLFKLFSIPFFGEKSLKKNKTVLKDIFQIILCNHCTIFQNSISEEAFLTNEQIDFLQQKHDKGEKIEIIHKEGNLTPNKIDQNKLEQLINDTNFNSKYDNKIQNLYSKEKIINDAKPNENIDLAQRYQHSLNLQYKNIFTQTDFQHNKNFSFSSKVIIFESKSKNKKSKTDTYDSNENRKIDASIITSDKIENNLQVLKKDKTHLQINQPFIIETMEHHHENHSSNEDFSEFESPNDSSSKSNSQSASSSATSSTTSSYSFYSYSRLEANLSKYGQTTEPTLQIRDRIENTNNSVVNNKSTSKSKKSKKNRKINDRSDTSDNISYSDNVANNCENIPKPPLILDYLNSNHLRKKTNYANNHNYNNNYFYADNSSENNTNNYSENKDNDKSDSQNGIEIKFDFYKNLVNSNTNEFLPPPPMLDPELLNSPIFGTNTNTKNFNQEDIYIKRELPQPIPSDDKNEDEDGKHVSFHLKRESNSNKNNNSNNFDNNNNNNTNIEESDSSLASSCKKEEEEKPDESCEEEEMKKEINDKDKKKFLYKYFKRKNEKKKKEEKKTKKDKPNEDEKKLKTDKKEKKDKQDKKPKKK